MHHVVSSVGQAAEILSPPGDGAHPLGDDGLDYQSVDREEDFAISIREAAQYGSVGILGGEDALGTLDAEAGFDDKVARVRARNTRGAGDGKVGCQLIFDVILVSAGLGNDEIAKVVTGKVAGKAGEKLKWLSGAGRGKCGGGDQEDKGL